MTEHSLRGGFISCSTEPKCPRPVPSTYTREEPLSQQSQVTYITIVIDIAKSTHTYHILL